MKKYEVHFNVDGRSGGIIYVTARDAPTARKVALAELQGRAGYANTKIAITSAHQVS